jgi:hypothetical protein
VDQALAVQARETVDVQLPTAFPGRGGAKLAHRAPKG